MAVSKRTRFEVLKRDNYTCRYCRSTEGQLTVDHVTPTALGGTDEPSNLTAACKDCNAGKSSTSPDAATVEDVHQDAVRHAELVRQSYRILVARMGDREEYVAEWCEAWTQPTLYLPDEWESSIIRWFEMGVPIQLLTDAARIACTRRSVGARGRFAYMAGIVWSQVKMIDELAESRLHIDGSFMVEEDLADMRMTAYEQGYEAGREDGAALILNAVYKFDDVAYVIDGGAR